MNENNKKVYNFLRSPVSEYITDLYHNGEITDRQFRYITTKYRETSEIFNYIIKMYVLNKNKLNMKHSRILINSHYRDVLIILNLWLCNQIHGSKILNLFATLKKSKLEELKIS